MIWLSIPVNDQIPVCPKRAEQLKGFQRPGGARKCASNGRAKPEIKTREKSCLKTISNMNTGANLSISFAFFVSLKLVGEAAG
jgi:hypothetical protein